MLNGIRRDLQEQLVADGYPVRVYVPYGHAFLIYASAQVRRPVILLWLMRDALLRSRSRYRLTGRGF